jgi:hypothetical protein
MANFEFPDIPPSARQYTPGNFPQTEFRAQNGALTILAYGNRRFDSTLSLEFQNITDDQAVSILDNYENVNNGDNRVIFRDDNVAVGASTGLKRYIKEVDSNLRWRYAGPPEVTSTYVGRSTVRCEFIGTLPA